MPYDCSRSEVGAGSGITAPRMAPKSASPSTGSGVSMVNLRLADFIDLCEENDDRQTEPFAHLTPEVTGFDYEHTLATVWNVSLHRIDERSTRLLRLLTYLDPDAVPEDLLRKGAGGHKDLSYLAAAVTWLKVSRELRKHGLCSKVQIYGDSASRLADSEPVISGLATHRLVLKTVFHRSSDTEKRVALEHAVALLKQMFPPVSNVEFRLSARWRECHMLLPQVEAVVRRCKENRIQPPSDFVPVLCACARYLVERRSFPDAEERFTVAQEVCKTHGLDEWQETQLIQRSLGGILLESTVFRHDEAVRIFRDVVAYYEATLHPEDPVLGLTYSGLAQALTARGDYDEAISLSERALDITSKLEDTGSRLDKMFHIHHNMARIYEMKGMPKEALRLHFYHGDAQGNGLRQERSVYGAWNLYAIGNCLQLQKDPRALEIHMKALKIRQELLGDHYYTAISHHKLGQLYLNDGAFHEASEAFQEAHRILIASLATTEAELARTLWYWSRTKKHMGQDQAAVELRGKAIRIRNRLVIKEGRVDDTWDDEEFDDLVVYSNR